MMLRTKNNSHCVYFKSIHVPRNLRICAILRLRCAIETTTFLRFEDENGDVFQLFGGHSIALLTYVSAVYYIETV